MSLRFLEINSKELIKRFFDSISNPVKKRRILAIVTLLIVTFILCCRFFIFQSVTQDGVSKHEIRADRMIEVVDKATTDAKKLEVSNRLKPVYKPVSDISNVLMENDLRQILDDISVLREKSLKETINISDFYDEMPELKLLDSKNNNILIFLVKQTTDYNWNQIQTLSKEVLLQVLNQGVTQEEVFTGKTSLILSYLPRSVSKQNQDSIVFLVNASINQANLAIDNEATEVARKNAIDAVEDVKVFFHKGEIVISKGEKLTPLKYEVLRKMGYTVNRIDLLILFGVLCFVIITMYIIWYYLISYDKYYVSSLKHLLLLSTISIVILFLGLLIYFLPPISMMPLVMQYKIPIYILPVAAFTLIMTFFFNNRIAMLVTTLLIFLIGVIFNFAIVDMFVLLIGSLVAVFKTSSAKYYKDSSLIECGIAVGLAQVLLVLSFYLVSNNFYFDLNIQDIFLNAFVALIGGFFTGALTIAAMPHLEAVFKIVTDHGLLELFDQNQPLLRRLQFEAPGTYHHSLMVSTLAESAAESVGASTVLVKVAALYHDIGKLKRPAFFIENQAYFGTDNPHDKLNPRLSKMVLTAHAKDGLELAKQYKLPESIQDVIIQHHGEGLMIYFYRSAIDLEGSDKVLEDQFRYMGPRPKTKESAIVMLSDATESAVRGLNNPTVTAIEDMVKFIIDERLSDGQLSDSPLTLKELSIISQTFIRVLKGMQHNRIDYQDKIIKELGDKNNIDSLKQRIDKSAIAQPKMSELNVKDPNQKPIK